MYIQHIFQALLFSICCVCDIFLTAQKEGNVLGLVEMVWPAGGEEDDDSRGRDNPHPSDRRSD